jgi:UDP-N-acetyl-2-amino-2-deoxyglucuronate dehydrogenase
LRDIFKKREVKNFALIGAAGYIAPRHMKAVKDTGNELCAAYDSFDSVGIIDSFFPKCSFFTQYELFERHVTKMANNAIVGEDGACSGKLDYVSICTPNYLHDAHIRFGLRSGADVICEKPLVLNPWSIDALQKVEEETGGKVYNILQLRLHNAIIDLKKRVDQGDPGKVYDIDLTYITSRGNWYYTSWKGDVRKSGGVATNIGVHFYDMLSWVFGKVKQNIVHVSSHDRVAGYLELDKARVRYFLSINADTLPQEAAKAGKRTYRSLMMEGQEVEFSDGFTELHTESYKHILSGAGFGLEEARKSIEIVHNIRNATPVGLKGDYHPFAKIEKTAHPFGWSF